MERRDGVMVTPVLDSLADVKSTGPMVAWEGSSAEAGRIRVVVFEKAPRVNDGRVPRDLVLEEYLGQSSFDEPAWRSLPVGSLLLMVLRGLAIASGFERVMVPATEMDQVYVRRRNGGEPYLTTPSFDGWRRVGAELPAPRAIRPSLVADGVLA
jgi:hypothetical protein